MSYQEIFNPEEWTELKDTMNAIRDRIPENQMNRVWNAYQRISKDNSNMPCSCQSAARYWINAVNVINDFIRQQSLLQAGNLAKEINNQEKI
jgi:hypothetical protein